MYYNAKLLTKDWPWTMDDDYWHYRFVRIVRENSIGWKIRSWREPFGRWVSKEDVLSKVEKA